MRVLILNWRDLSHPRAGGAEVWAQRVAENLRDRGHLVTHFSAAVEGRPSEEVVEQIRFVRAGGKLGVYRQARRFVRHEQSNFDVILEEINTRPFFAASWSCLPVVAMIHQIAGDVWSYETRFPLSLIGRYVLEPRWLRKLDAETVMTLSPSSAESLQPFGFNNPVVVLPGFDEPTLGKHQKSTQPTVLFLGRLTPSKRPDHAVAAFGRLQQVFPSARLVVLGGGSLLEALRKSATDGVEFRGFVSADEREKMLREAHVLITTTVREGWGLNVSEAAAHGTPTIGYKSPGLVDSISVSGGHLVNESPEALGAALVDFFSGRLPLEPKILSRSWHDVALEIEQQLAGAILSKSQSKTSI